MKVTIILKCLLGYSDINSNHRKINGIKYLKKQVYFSFQKKVIKSWQELSISISKQPYVSVQIGLVIYTMAIDAEVNYTHANTQ